MISFVVNNQLINTNASAGVVALDFIREQLRLTGTKEGCKEGECGACTILVGELSENKRIVSYKAMASCILPVGCLHGKHVVTVEGLNMENDLNLVQQKIFDNNASQCGFCTPGIVLSLTGFLLSSENFLYDDAINALDGNICRCTGYYPIRNAAKELCNYFSSYVNSDSERVALLVEHNVMPEYFKGIHKKLLAIENNNESSTGGKVVAGGTDLFVQQPDTLSNEKLQFISEVKEMNNLYEEKGNICIGASVTVEQLRTSSLIKKYFPSLEKELLLVSSAILRNKATLAGNIVNASPIGDLTIILLALNSQLVLKQSDKFREVRLADFYFGYKKFDLKCRELITQIKIPLPNKESKFSFEKVSNRKYLDIASCNTAMSITLQNKKVIKLSISAGGIAPVPVLLEKASYNFLGKEISIENINKLLKDIDSEISPIDDIRGSAKYKRLLLRQLVKAHFIKLCSDNYDEFEGRR